MILVDANILLYAMDQHSPRHDQARQWWDAQLSGAQPVALCWPVMLAFLRISTNHRVFRNPLGMDRAAACVRDWLAQPCVRVIQATPGHWSILQRLLAAAQAVGNLVADAHLAALAIEHGCTLYSTDADFARFPSLKWKNPLN